MNVKAGNRHYLIFMLMAVVFMSPLLTTTSAKAAEWSVSKTEVDSGAGESFMVESDLCFTFIDWMDEYRAGGYGTDWKTGVQVRQCGNRFRVLQVGFRVRYTESPLWSGTSFTNSFVYGRNLLIADNLRGASLNGQPGSGTETFWVPNIKKKWLHYTSRSYFKHSGDVEVIGVGPLPNNHYDYDRRIYSR